MTTLEISVSYRVYDTQIIEVPADRLNDLDLDDEEVLTELLGEFGGLSYGEDEEIEVGPAEIIGDDLDG